jgi:RNA polymerase sporulation-specific sigma factor
MTEEELVLKYDALIYKVAKKFYNVELADLFQAGRVGLIKAIRKFDNNLGTDFISFAYMHIFGEMYDLANKSRDIKLNKYYLKMYKKIQIAKLELINKLNREPRLDEISTYLNLDENLISEVLILSSQILSLDAEYETLNGNGMTVIDTVGETIDMDSKILIDESLNRLEPLEQDVIKIRYFQDLTQAETAAALGISQVKVSRIEKCSKQKIKEYIVT